MSIEFIQTSHFSSKDLHLKIVDIVTKNALYNSLDPTVEEKTEAFRAKYRAAMKVSLAELSEFIIKEGHELLQKDPNSNQLLTRTTCSTSNASACT